MSKRSIDFSLCRAYTLHLSLSLSLLFSLFLSNLHGSSEHNLLWLLFGEHFSIEFTKPIYTYHILVGCATVLFRIVLMLFHFKKTLLKCIANGCDYNTNTAIWMESKSQTWCHLAFSEYASVLVDIQFRIMNNS